jgi:hypothetical protein
MKPSLLALCAVTLLLTACGLSDQQKADYSRVQNSGVSPAIYDKMVNGDDLSIGDIEALSRAHVNSGIILRYLRDNDTVYYLAATDVTRMEKVGVDPSVVDYMLQTARGGWWGAGPYPYFGVHDPFWYGPGFYGGYFGYGYGGRFHGHRR